MAIVIRTQFARDRRSMLTVFYTAARISVMVFGWLFALALGFASDYMLAGSLWPMFLFAGSWWTLAFILLVRSEVEMSDSSQGRFFRWRQSSRS